MVPLGLSLCVLRLLLRHDRTFVWTRYPDPENESDLQFFFEYPLATTFQVDEDGQVRSIKDFWAVADPRNDAAEQLLATARIHNALCQQTRPNSILLIAVKRDEATA
jgi:hypothetical protein